MSDRKPRLVDTMVGWIHPQVMVFLGKVQNPMTGKTERDLPSARLLIDLLAELEEKTEGRLEEGEKRHLKTALTELRLNYLDEMNRPATAPDEERTGEVPGTAGAGSNDEAQPAGTGSDADATSSSSESDHPASTEKLSEK